MQSISQFKMRKYTFVKGFARREQTTERKLPFAVWIVDFPFDNRNFIEKRRLFFVDLLKTFRDSQDTFSHLPSPQAPKSAV